MVAVSSRPQAQAEIIKPSSNLSGLEEIAQYTRRSKATVLDWIRNEGFPAAKLGHVWESDKDMVDAWKREKIEKSRRALMTASATKTAGRKKASSTKNAYHRQNNDLF